VVVGVVVGLVMSVGVGVGFVVVCPVVVGVVVGLVVAVGVGVGFIVVCPGHRKRLPRYVFVHTPSQHFSRGQFTRALLMGE